MVESNSSFQMFLCMHVRVRIDLAASQQDSRVDRWRETFGSFQDVVATLRDGEEVVDDLDGLARAHRDLGLAVTGLRAHMQQL